MPEEETNEDFRNRLIQGIGGETAIGVAADILLPSPDPISRGLNFGIGYGANVLSQWWRGQEFSHGEAVAAGGFQAIPFGTVAKGAKGLFRAAAKGATGAVVGEQVRVGIDEQRLLTFPEAVRAGAFGGTLGTAVKGGEEVFRGVRRNINLKKSKEAYQTGTDIMAEKGYVKVPVSPEDRQLGVRLMAEIDNTPLGNFRGKDYYETTLDPVYQRNLLSGDRTRYEGKAAVVSAPGESILTLSKFHAEAKALKTDLLDSLTPQWDYPIKFDIHQKGRDYAYRSHHEIPLLPSAKLKEGLNDAAKIELDTYMLEQGNPQGNQLSNLTIIPHDFHQPILHKTIIDLQLGGHGDLSTLVEKHYPGRNLYDLELWERKVIADDLIKIINQAREATYDFYRALAAFKDSSTPLSRLDVNTIIEAAARSDRFGLDELLEQMIGGANKRTALVKGFKTKFKKDFEDAIIDEIIADMSGIKRVSPLPRLINNIAVDTTGVKVALDRLGIMFRADGTVAQKKPLSAVQINRKYGKKYNKDQLELFDDIEVTPELIQNLKLREELIRRSGSAGRLGPADTPSDKGQD